MPEQIHPEEERRPTAEEINALADRLISRFKNVPEAMRERGIRIALEDIQAALENPGKSILKAQHPSYTREDFASLLYAAKLKATEIL